MESPRTYRGILSGLTPNVLKLGWVSLLGDISSEMLYPVIPIFLTTVIGAPVSALGFIEGVAEAIASLLKTISGAISDRTGKRRPLVFSGYILSSLSRPVIALATGWPLVLFARGLDRFGKGLRTSPRDALIADSVSDEFRGKAFGWHRGMDTFGAIFGPLIAVALISAFHDNLRWIFVVSFIPGIVSAFLVLTVQEIHRPPADPSQPVSNFTFNTQELNPQFRSYLVAWMIFSLTNSSDMFILLRAKELGCSIQTTIYLYCFYNFTYSVASPSFGQLSDQLGRKNILVTGLLIFSAVYAGFALATHDWQLWILFAVYGLYIAATDGVGKALAVDLVPASARARSIGLLGTVTGFSTLFASSMAGLLWSHYGSWATFTYGAIGALMSSAMIASRRWAR